MNFGSKHPLAVLDLLGGACGASACDTGGLEFETKIVGKDLHIRYLLQGRALKSHVIGKRPAMSRWRLCKIPEA